MAANRCFLGPHLSDRRRSTTFLLMLNEPAFQLCDAIVGGLSGRSAAPTLATATGQPNGQAMPPRLAAEQIGGATVIDAGVGVSGSLQAGLWMARVCLGDAALVELASEDADRYASDTAVRVQTDWPLEACLGGQYAGWPVSIDDYFAMASGPMRMARGREEMLLQLGLRESASEVAGVLEATSLPPAAVIEAMAQQCGVEPRGLALLVAPAGSLAGSIQVVARSVETAMHKLHVLGFDVRCVYSAAGTAPLGAPARPDDIVGGIGRTNDAILYGGRVTLWVDCDQAAVDAVAEAVPSSASKDHGRPFAAIFKDYDHDFYQVDPLLFSPAVVSIVNRRSGISRLHGRIETDVLRASLRG